MYFEYGENNFEELLKYINCMDICYVDSIKFI